MMDQIYENAIFIGWVAVAAALAFTAVLTKRRWLERVCIGVGLGLFAIPLLGFMLLLIVD
jgi:hypothetical protein